MAGIDKTYTDNYQEYKEFKEWADAQYLTFFDGYKVRIGHWVWIREKEDFKNGEIPIMNSPTWLDVFLFQNCKSEFVLDRLRRVYGKDWCKKALSLDFTGKPPKDFQQNRKIIIKENEGTFFPLHNKPFGKRQQWWLQNDGYSFSYFDETKTWTNENTLYPKNTNTAHFKTVKAVIRHLRKQYLPKGVKFTLSGRYIGEEYDILIN